MNAKEKRDDTQSAVSSLPDLSKMKVKSPIDIDLAASLGLESLALSEDEVPNARDDAGTSGEQARMFGIYTGLRGDSSGNGGLLAIGFSIVVIVIASLTFILDFDLIEQSVQQGAPRRMAWTCAFGLLVGLIWVYLEVLRLLSYLRGK